MPAISDQLMIERCPQCGIAAPNLYRTWLDSQQDRFSDILIQWAAYKCQSCSQYCLVYGVGPASMASQEGILVEKIYPEPELSIPEELPDRAREYLRQAKESIGQPAGAVVLAASAVDSMLKAKGYKEGSLYSRIDKAASDHLITDGMAKWAHHVRLESNSQRHADDSDPLPTVEDARRVIKFTDALVQFLFVLPALIDQGIEQTSAN